MHMHTQFWPSPPPLQLQLTHLTLHFFSLAPCILRCRSFVARAAFSIAHSFVRSFVLSFATRSTHTPVDLAKDEGAEDVKRAVLHSEAMREENVRLARAARTSVQSGEEAEGAGNMGSAREDGQIVRSCSANPRGAGQQVAPVRLAAFRLFPHVGTFPPPPELRLWCISTVAVAVAVAVVHQCEWAMQARAIHHSYTKRTLPAFPPCAQPVLPRKMSSSVSLPTSFSVCRVGRQLAASFVAAARRVNG